MSKIVFLYFKELGKIAMCFFAVLIILFAIGVLFYAEEYVYEVPKAIMFVWRGALSLVGVYIITRLIVCYTSHRYSWLYQMVCSVTLPVLFVLTLRCDTMWVQAPNFLKLERNFIIENIDDDPDIAMPSSSTQSDSFGGALPDEL